MTALAERPRLRNRRSRVFDVAVALAAFGQSLPYVLDPHGLPAWTLLLIAVGLSVPLVERRRWPLRVFLVLVGLAAAVGWWAPQSVFTVGLLIALYTVTVGCSRPPALGCAVVLAAATVVWSLRLYADWRPVAIVLVAVVAATTAFGLYIGARRTLLLEVQDRAERLEFERDQQATIAAAAERARIAREMHDVVAHHLTVMVTLADGAAARAGRAPALAGDAMRAVAATGREALTDTRRLLGVLREASGEPDRAPLPTLADLDDLVSGVRAAGLDVCCTIAGAAPDLDTGSQLALYRLVQEALTNTLRHAGATRAEVTIDCDADAVRVRVSDDGTGAIAAGAPGRGLVGMRERLTAVGGRVEFGPAPAGGWSVRAELPVPR